MKKIVLLITLFVFTLGFSQVKVEGDIEIFPTVGSTQSGTSFFTNTRSSIRAGVLGDYYLNDRWSIRSGLEVLGLGDSGLLFFQRQLKLFYMNVPLNANWHFGSTRKWNLNFGLSPGFLLDAEENGVDVSNSIESFQLGLSYGIGYKLTISDSFSILFDTQAFIGLTNYRRNSSSEEQHIANSFNIGAVFKL